MFASDVCSEHSEEAQEGAIPIADGDIETNWDEVIESFDGMDLREDLLRGIYAYGFEKPSAIQQRAVKPILLGHDCIAQAQSGTCNRYRQTDRGFRK